MNFAITKHDSEMENPFDTILKELRNNTLQVLALRNELMLSLPKNKIDEKYLSRAEVIETLHITLSTLNEWTKSGKIKAYRIGRRVLYKQNDIDAALIAINTGK